MTISCLVPSVPADDALPGGDDGGADAGVVLGPPSRPLPQLHGRSASRHHQRHGSLTYVTRALVHRVFDLLKRYFSLAPSSATDTIVVPVYFF